MIKSNLAIIMAEKKIKISELSRKTGISRVTLTSLYYNNSGGIQFDTLNNLCNFFNVKPADILVYYPFDYKIKDLSPDIDGGSIFEIEYITNGKSFLCSLVIELFIEKDIEPEDDAGGVLVTGIFIDIYLSDRWELPDGEVESSENADHFIKFFESLPKNIINDMEEYITNKCFETIADRYHIEDFVNMDFKWNF